MKRMIVLAFGTIVFMNINANANEIILNGVTTNQDANASVTTSMNGNTSTNTGIPISSTSASAEGRH